MKNEEDLRRERESKVAELARFGLLRTEPGSVLLRECGEDGGGMREIGMEPGRLLGLADEMAIRAREEDAGHAALAVLAAHSVLEVMVNRLGGEAIGSFNYRARFLPKWHDLCERTLGRQLEAAPDLERLQALRDAVVGYRGDPERLDRRSTSPPPEAPRAVGAEEARWAVETARRVVAEFHRAAGRNAPSWV